MFPWTAHSTVSRVAWDEQSARWWTAGELHDAVQRLAEALAASAPGLLFCFCQNDLDSLTGYWAGLQSPHATALLDAALHPDLVQPLLAAYHPEWLLYPPAVPDSYQAAGYPGLFRRTSPVDSAIHPEVKLLLSTSGSTGSPKFVRLSLHNLQANASSIRRALDLQPSDRAVTSLPPHYSFGLSVINSHLSRGATLVFTRESLTSPKFWETVRSHECTHFAGVPYTYQILRRLDLERLQVPSLKTLLQAGGKLAPELVVHFHELMQRRQGRFFVMYGQTEATARIAILPATETLNRPASVGLPIPDGAVFIANPGEPGTTTPGVTGELIYQGPNVMLGYATCRADLSRGDEQGGRLATGDIAHLDADGYIYITGRAKRDAKIAGLRINLDEVEALLRPRTTASVIYKDNLIHVFCEEPDADMRERWRLELAQQLRLHHLSFRFHPISVLPTTSSGKIDYQALADLA